MESHSTEALKIEHTRSVVLDLLLTILLCGLWNIVVQYSQCKTLNYLLKAEKYNLLKIGLLSLVTCGIYYIYFEYQKAVDFQKITNTTDNSDSILALVLAIFGFGWVYDAFLQSKINALFEQKPFNPAD